MEPLVFLLISTATEHKCKIITSTKNLHQGNNFTAVRLCLGTHEHEVSQNVVLMPASKWLSLKKLLRTPSLFLLNMGDFNHNVKSSFSKALRFC